MREIEPWGWGTGGLGADPRSPRNSLLRGTQSESGMSRVEKNVGSGFQNFSRIGFRVEKKVGSGFGSGFRNFLRIGFRVEKKYGFRVSGRRAG